MSYDDDDYKWDQFYDTMSEELYPQHKELAIEEFTTERLQSFYLKNPYILIPGVNMYAEARELVENHPTASFVLATSAIELFLKASLLKPVVYGLVHNESLANIIVKEALGASGFKRYKKLLSGIFNELVDIDINKVKRIGSDKFLLTEASGVQTKRNEIIHQGKFVSKSEANFAIEVAYGILHDIINPMLLSIGLWKDKNSTVLERKEGKKA